MGETKNRALQDLSNMREISHKVVNQALFPIVTARPNFFQYTQIKMTDELECHRPLLHEEKPAWSADRVGMRPIKSNSCSSVISRKQVHEETIRPTTWSDQTNKNVITRKPTEAGLKVAVAYHTQRKITATGFFKTVHEIRATDCRSRSLPRQLNSFAMTKMNVKPVLEANPLPTTELKKATEIATSVGMTSGVAWQTTDYLCLRGPAMTNLNVIARKLVDYKSTCDRGNLVVENSNLALHPFLALAV